MNTDSPVPQPTWYQDIKGLFTPMDVSCMKKFGSFDLSKYQDVKDNAQDIYDMVSTHQMPKGEQTWSTDMIQTFQNWMNDGYLMGTPPATAEMS